MRAAGDYGDFVTGIGQLRRDVAADRAGAENRYAHEPSRDGFKSRRPLSIGRPTGRQ